MIDVTVKRIQKERWIKLFVFLTLLFLLFLTIVFVHNMFVSFLLAFVTYYMMAPAVDWLERRGLSRTLSTTIPFLVLTAVISALITWLVPVVADQISTLQKDYPVYLESANKVLSGIEAKVNDTMKNVYPIDLRAQIEPSVVGWATNFFQNLPEIISKSFTVLFMVPFLAFFMLVDGRDFVRKLLSFVPNNVFELVVNLNYQIGTQMGGFIRARFLESLIVAFVIWVGLLILGFPYALLLSIFAAILNVIPYVGPVIGFMPALLISVGSGGSGTEMFWLFMIYLIAQIIDTAVLVPFLVAKIVDLHPVTVVIAIFIGAQFMGIIGMIICIPVVSALKVSMMAIYKHAIDFRE